MTFPSFTRKRYLPVGFDMGSGEELSIALDYLATHLHILGPPGSGKTRWLLWLFQQLTRIPNATIFFFTSKGTVCHQARAWAINHGLTARIDWLGLDDPDHVLGYSPLRPNGLSVSVHAKAVREGIRSAWGQAAFTDTPQLARFLYLVLYAVRELELTFVEALAMLRPQSEVRHAILPAIRDPYVRQCLEYVDGLREPRQDELLASTLARLEAFVADPMIRRILTQQKHSFNVGEAIANHRIVLAPFLNYAPLRPDDVKLLARLAINDILAHTFAANHDPVFLIIDEAHDFLTEDLCRVLAQGRELKLHAVLAHQFLRQLQTENTTLIQDSVWECARTKIIFGGVSFRELEVLTPEVMIDQFDPWKTKDEIRTLEQEAIETQREATTQGESTSESLTRGEEISEGHSSSRTQGQEQSHGQSLGVSTELGQSETLGETETYTQGTVNTQGYAVSDGEGTGYSDLMASGETILPDGNGGLALSSNNIMHTTSHASGSSSSRFRSKTETSSDSEIRTAGDAFTWTKGRSRSLGQNTSVSETRGVSQSESQGVQKGQSASRSLGITRGKNTTKSAVPFHEYKKRRVVSSRQFLSKEEQMTIALQKIKSLPKGHFLLKVPNHQAVFVRAPFVKDPFVPERQLAAAMARIHEKPYYATPEQIATEEQERAARLRQLTAATAASALPATLQDKAKEPKLKTTPTEKPREKKAKTELGNPWEMVDTKDRPDSPDKEN